VGCPARDRPARYISVRTGRAGSTDIDVGWSLLGTVGFVTVPLPGVLVAHTPKLGTLVVPVGAIPVGLCRFARSIARRSRKPFEAVRLRQARAPAHASSTGCGR